MGLREGSEVWLKFGQAENLALNVPPCHMSLVPALGGEAVVDWQDMNSGLYWYKDIEITRLISPTGPQQCYLCHHSSQLGWECSEVPSVNAVLYSTGLVLLQFLRIGCCHCSLNCQKLQSAGCPALSVWGDFMSSPRKPRVPSAAFYVGGTNMLCDMCRPCYLMGHSAALKLCG